MKISLQSLYLFLICSIFTWVVNVYGQNEICHFYGLNADCRYRVDLICLSHITAEIDPCADPVAVTFKIKCSSPNVDFEHRFSSSDTMVSVPGYSRQVYLQVRMRMKEDDVLNIEADIHVYGQASADFLNHDVKMAGYNENCPGLNQAAKIAIGVMGGLAGVAACMIAVLLYTRHRRRKHSQEQPALVENSEGPGLSTPRNSRNFDTTENHVTQNTRQLDNHVTRPHENGGHVTPSGHATSQDVLIGQNSNRESQQLDSVKTGQVSHEDKLDANLEDQVNPGSTESSPRVRYSDVLKTSDVPFKISEC